MSEADEIPTPLLKRFLCWLFTGHRCDSYIPSSEFDMPGPHSFTCWCGEIWSDIP